MTQAAPPTFPPAGVRLPRPVPGERDVAEAAPGGPPAGTWPSPNPVDQPGPGGQTGPGTQPGPSTQSRPGGPAGPGGQPGPANQPVPKRPARPVVPTSQPRPLPAFRPSTGALSDLSRPASPPRTAGPRPGSASWAQAASQRAAERPNPPDRINTATAQPPPPPLQPPAPEPAEPAAQYSVPPTFEPTSPAAPRYNSAPTAPPAFAQPPPAPPAPPTGQQPISPDSGGRPGFPAAGSPGPANTGSELPAPLFPPPSGHSAPELLPFGLTESTQPPPQQQWTPPPAPASPPPQYAQTPQLPPIEPESPPEFGDFGQTELSFDAVGTTSAASESASPDQGGVDDWVWANDPLQPPASGPIESAELAEANFGMAATAAPSFGPVDHANAAAEDAGLVDLALPQLTPPAPPIQPQETEAPQPAWPDDDAGFASPLSFEPVGEAFDEEATPDFAEIDADPSAVLTVETAAADLAQAAPANSKLSQSRTDRFPDPVIDDPQAGNPWVSGLWISGAVAAIIGIILLGTVSSQLTNAVGMFFIIAGALALVAAASLSTVRWWSRRSANQRN